MTNPAAIVLIAHGSRRPEANADLVRLAEILGPRLPDERLEIAYLELAEPTIPMALERCVDAGAKSIRMLPYFLSAGAHVSRDLEDFRQRFAERYPDVNISLCPPLGLHPKIIEVVLDRLSEVT